MLADAIDGQDKDSRSKGRIKKRAFLIVLNLNILVVSI